MSEDNLIFVWGKDIYNNIVIKCEHDILNICIYQYLYILTRNGKFLYYDIISNDKIFKNIECTHSIECIFYEFGFNLVFSSYRKLCTYS